MIILFGIIIIAVYGFTGNTGFHIKPNITKILFTCVIILCLSTIYFERNMLIQDIKDVLIWSIINN
jgi:uncharacterized membrane protein YtjA (UPF0391 family)